MSQPVLRAELESDLKKICEGKAEKNEVLRRHIAKYKRVYKEAVANANKWEMFWLSCNKFLFKNLTTL